MCGIYEFFKVQKSILVHIRFLDSSFHELFYLLLVEIGPNHHSEHYEQILRRYEAVLIKIVKLKGESVLVLLCASHRELRQALNKLNKSYFSIFVLVKALYDLLGKRILSKGRDFHKGVNGEIPLAFGVKLGKPLIKLIDFRGRKNLVD